MSGLVSPAYLCLSRGSIADRVFFFPFMPILSACIAALMMLNLRSLVSRGTHITPSPLKLGSTLSGNSAPSLCLNEAKKTLLLTPSQRSDA